MENYKHPPIPTGYTHRSGDWDNGFIIRRDADGSEFVWIPVGVLAADGKLGKESGLPFGYRPYGYSGGLPGDVPEELQKQAESVQKHGGFYLSRYCLSMGEDGALHSVPNATPFTGVGRVDAAHMVGKFESADGVASHLPYAAEQDSAIAWLITGGKLTEKAVANAAGRRDAKNHKEPVELTGADESLYGNAIYDLAGTVDEWTQESMDGAHNWGCCKPCAYPNAYRCYFTPYACYTYTGMRAALYIG